jgi:hypothetical protein
MPEIKDWMRVGFLMTSTRATKGQKYAKETTSKFLLVRLRALGIPSIKAKPAADV